MAVLKFVPPSKGLDTHAAFSGQPAATSRDLLNVRPEDPKTGRERVATRSGLSKFTDPPSPINGSAKVLHGTNLTYDSRNVSYAATTLASGTRRWGAIPPQKLDVRNLARDEASNLYVLDGRVGVAKYNNVGELQWRCALPAADEAQFCRAIAVDEVGNVYVGTSEGGRQDKSRLWKLVQGTDNQVFVKDTEQGAWELELEGFVEDCHVQNGLLYTIQNFPDRWGAKLVVYSAIGTAVPLVAWSRESIPYPVNSFALKADDSVITSHEPNLNRGLDPRYPDFTQVTVDWTPRDLANYDRRVFSWYHADSLIGLQEDQPVFLWEDISGNERHLVRYGTNLAPTFNTRGMAGKPTVRFIPTAALASQVNPSTNADFADQQKTITPSWTGATDAQKSMYALFIVFRPEVSANVRCLFSQPIGATSNSTNKKIGVNRAAGATWPGTAAAGSISIFETAQANTAGPTNTSTIPTAGVIATAAPQACVLTLICDGGRAASSPQSLLRVDGTPIDRWRSTAGASLINSVLGAVNEGDTAGNAFSGDIREILCLRDFSGATDGLLSHPYAPDAGGDLSGNSELEQIEGYLAHGAGIAHKLPVNHPFYLTNGPPRGDGPTVVSKEFLLHSDAGICAKWKAANGELAWVVTGRAAVGPFLAVPAAGVGYGCAVDPDGNVYTTGPKSGTFDPTDNSWMRKIIDNGDSATISGAATIDNSPTPNSLTGAWSKTYADVTGATPLQNWTYKYPRLECDSFGNVYVPWAADTTAARSVTIWDKTGQYHLSGAYSVTSPSGLDGYCVAIDPLVPDYDEDFAGGSAAETPRAEYFYVGTTNDADPTVQSLWAVRFAEVASETGSPRSVVHLAVAGGSIKRFDGSTITTPAGAGTLAAPQLDPSSQFVSSAVSFGEVFFTDGLNYRVFNPRADTVLEFKSKSAGLVPPRCKLICSWRGRLVLARGADDPHNWHMSKFGDPYDWDTNPPVATAVDAIDGNDPRIGKPADIINALIPANDDLLYFGCDHSIYRLTGDPQSGSAQFDAISETIGIAFGPSWCKSPSGAIFAFGTDGRVYVLTGGAPVAISERVPSEMREFDLAAYYPVLVWNTKDDGLHVLQVPYGGGGVPVRHWFWSAASKGWFPDQFGRALNTGVQPTYAWVVDGDDSSDRTLLFGCEDGYVRRWDEAARTDDSLVIESRFLCGPLAGDELGRVGRATKLRIQLADDQDGTRYKLFASQNPDTVGLTIDQGGLTAGRNIINLRGAGNYLFLEIGGAAVNQRWAFESAELDVFPAGRQRERFRG